MEIDQEIFNMMLAKSMHQIVRIEFRNSKFPYARGSAPLQPPPGGQPPGTPVIGQQFGPPFPAAGSAPACIPNLPAALKPQICKIALITNE